MTREEARISAVRRARSSWLPQNLYPQFSSSIVRANKKNFPCHYIRLLLRLHEHRDTFTIEIIHLVGLNLCSVNTDLQFLSNQSVKIYK